MNENDKIIAWWSGGVTSAVTCKICIDLYGVENVRVIFIDTKNEHEDTARFKVDCEKWYNIDIETISCIGEKYDNIQEVWEHYLSLNIAHGAICSSELKRDVRKKWERKNKYKHQAFGFDVDEVNRAKGITKNHSHTNPIFPLLMYGYNKKQCIGIVEDAGIELPIMYQLGFHNNNCFGTGCVQGGIGYWQKMKIDFPDKFDKMAEMEHKLTDERGEPVTMLKDQSKDAKESGNMLVFLKPHKDYPNLKDISKMKGREVESLMECNGFCGSNESSKEKAQEQISTQKSLF